MSKIVLAAEISGTRNGKSWPPIGTEVDLPDDEASDMVAAGTAYRPDDDRVAALGGDILTAEHLAGAPEGRDWTEGQQDTNLSRARAMGLAKEDKRTIARRAAKETNLDDEHTVPSAVPNGPVVGDDQPDPTAVESAAVTPAAETATVDTTPKKRTT